MKIYNIKIEWKHKKYIGNIVMRLKTISVDWKHEEQIQCGMETENGHWKRSLKIGNIERYD